MKVYFNGTYISEEKIILKISNRAFLFGDGFFETVLGYAGEARLLSLHLQRITRALESMWMEVPKELSAEPCSHIVSELFRVNKIMKYARLKIVVWRGGEGAYMPDSHDSHLLITIIETSKPQPLHKANAMFSEKVRNHASYISPFKSISAQNYVLAALEMKEKKCDEIIITDTENQVSECLVSNIFWVKRDKVFTPSLKTGCVNGVSRTLVIEEFAKRNQKIEEVNAGKEELLRADSVFTTNAMGVAHITGIGNYTFTIFPKIESLYPPL